MTCLYYLWFSKGWLSSLFMLRVGKTENYNIRTVWIPIFKIFLSIVEHDSAKTLYLFSCLVSRIFTKLWICSQFQSQSILYLIDLFTESPYIFDFCYVVFPASSWPSAFVILNVSLLVSSWLKSRNSSIRDAWPYKINCFFCISLNMFILTSKMCHILFGTLSKFIFS